MPGGGMKTKFKLIVVCDIVEMMFTSIASGIRELTKFVGSRAVEIGVDTTCEYSVPLMQN